MEKLIKQVFESHATLSEWRNNFKSNEWKALNELHVKMYGKKLTQTKNCGCVDDFWNALRSKTQTKLIEKYMNKENARFVLKPNKIITVHGCTVIGENSTEAQFINLLSLYPTHISSFEKYPQDWEKIVNSKQVVKTVEEVVTVVETEAETTTNAVDYTDHTRKELIAVAKQKNIEYPHNVSKTEIFKLVTENK